MTGNRENGRQRGRVVWFNDALGYGFIRPEASLDAQGEIELPENKRLGDVFVHYTAISGNGHRTLTRGQWVEYGVIEQEMPKPQPPKTMAHAVVAIVGPGAAA